MTKAARTVLLIGSYNGQDSLGDECLLKSVIDQYRRATDGPLRIVLHAHTKTELLERMEREGECKSNPGLQTLFWEYRNKLRHTRLPVAGYTALAAMSFPAYVGGLAALRKKPAVSALQQIRDADVVHIFGGTNFSFQWFWLNVPYYITTSLLARMSGARLHFGPQQYGPMTPAQKQIMRLWIRLLAGDVRLRNPECVDLLGVGTDRLGADEVYCNRSLYPWRTPETDGSYILINLRGGALDDSSALQSSHITHFAELLRMLHDRTGLPYRFFAVSGDAFSHDEASFARLRSQVPEEIPMENAGRVGDEFALIELAQGARACISMSFHGCLLSGFAGIPFVPVTFGTYYDYKYQGFDVYGDGQAIPVVHLDTPATAQLTDTVHQFIESYDTEQARTRRELQAGELEAYYQRLVNASLV